MAQDILDAPSDRRCTEAPQILGHEPIPESDQRAPDEEVERYERDLDAIELAPRPRMERELATPEHQRRIEAAKAGLEDELERGRRAGILLFEATANAFDDAERIGNTALSKSAAELDRAWVNAGRKK